MSELLSHSTASEMEFTFRNKSIFIQVIYNTEEPNCIQFSNGESIESPCLNCENKPCLKFDEKNHSDIVEVVFSSDVCPTNALYLDEHEQIIIDEPNCIGCGLCAIRCPTGAIYLSNNKAVIHRDYTHLDIGKLSDTLKIEYIGCLVPSIEVKTLQILQEIKKANKTNIVTNNLIKSCFMALGFKVVKPRIGDINLRMDLILDIDKKLFIVEVDQLGSPDTVRDIIDDVAIFCNKYDKELNLISGISCLFEFPNKRSEYYELITDTINVLKFNIYSISLGVLLSLLFHRKLISIEKYTINELQFSCRKFLEENLDQKCDFSQKSSLIEASK
ncbi:4Fe-4S binding protein [Yersinia enterocolitica]